MQPSYGGAVPRDRAGEIVAGCFGTLVFIGLMLSIVGYVKPVCQAPDCKSIDELFCCDTDYNGSAALLPSMCKSHRSSKLTCSDYDRVCLNNQLNQTNQTWKCLHSTVTEPTQYALLSPGSHQQCDISGGCSSRVASMWGVIILGISLGAIVIGSILASCCGSSTGDVLD